MNRGIHRRLRCGPSLRQGFVSFGLRHLKFYSDLKQMPDRALHRIEDRLDGLMKMVNADYSDLSQRASSQVRTIFS